MPKSQVFGQSEGGTAGMVGIHRMTVSKCLKEDFNPVSPCYHTAVPSKLKPYACDIKNMLSERKTFKRISAAIREKGYDGSTPLSVCLPQGSTGS